MEGVQFFMAGEWQGQGKLVDKGVEYLEQVSILQTKPNLFMYTQRTQRLSDKMPLHSETGYFRVNPNSNGVELMLSHPFGVCEIEEGNLNQDKKTLELESRSIIRSSSAKEPEVKHVKRVFTVVENTLSYDLFMATSLYPLRHHLHCDMQRKQ